MASTRTPGVRSAMIRATASSEAVSVSIRKRGFTRRRIANPARGCAQKQSRLMELNSNRCHGNHRKALFWHLILRARRERCDQFEPFHTGILRDVRDVAVLDLAEALELLFPYF